MWKTEVDMTVLDYTYLVYLAVYFASAIVKLKLMSIAQ